MRTIKVGIIGTGFIGPAHVEALRRLGSVEVVGLAESNAGLAEEKAKLLGIPQAYGDYRDLLKDRRIEAIHNCTPNFVHFKINKDVIVKKLRADINAVSTRLKWIADNEKRTEELAKIKAAKTAAPREDQEGGKDKKSKESPAEGKEKAAAPKKNHEEGKVKTSKEVPVEGKEKKKKKEDNNPETSE